MSQVSDPFPLFLKYHLRTVASGLSHQITYQDQLSTKYVILRLNMYNS